MKSFVFDIDGTICNNAKYIDEEIECEIAKILDSKIDVVFASARPIRDMLPLLPVKYHKCLLIGCNGGISYKDGDFLSIAYFRHSEFQVVLKYLKKHKIPFVLDGDWFYSVSEDLHPFHNYIRSLSNYELTEKEIEQKGITKILILDSKFKYQVEDFLTHNNISHSLNLHTRDDCFDITPSLNNKLIALQNCNIDLTSSVVFGNDKNDFEMLKEAGKSVFVGDDGFFDRSDVYTEFEGVAKIISQEFLKLKR